MRVLLLSEIFPPKIGGSGRYVWELYRRLPKDRSVIVAGADSKQDAFDATHDLPVYRVPLSFPTRFLRTSSLPYYRSALRELRRLVRREAVTCVHAGRTVPEGLLAWMLKRTSGVPYVCSTHGEEINPSNVETVPAWYQRRIYSSRELAQMVGLILRNASRIIASSHNARDILRNRWQVSADRIRLLHPGVDTCRFRPAARDPVVRSRLGWAERPVVLTVGRLQKRKGHDMLISALPKIRRAIPEILYSIVGSGEERATLGSLVQDRQLGDHVQFLEEVRDEELIQCYQQCDLFALPNRQVGGDIEGIGLVLLEAQAVGKPVVAGDSGGTRETMRIPETGVVVPCDDPAPLARQIAELLGDPRRLEVMGMAGREWVTTEFDWRARTSQLEDLFNESALSGMTC